MRRDHGVDSGFEGIEVVGVDAPEDRILYQLVGVPKDVADVSHVVPRNRRSQLPLPSLG